MRDDLYFAANTLALRLLLLVLLLLPASLLANNENDPAGARPAGMANAALSFTDIWSIYHNQAGLAYLDGITAGVFYENRFLMKEFNYSGIAAGMPLGNGAIGLSYTGFGFSVYNESKTGITYAMKLAKTLSASVQLNYQTTRINADNYGKQRNVTAELGMRMEVSEKVVVGAHVFNPFKAKLNDFNDERIPTVLRIGVAYQIGDDLLFAVETEKDIERTALFRGGIEYHPAEIFYLRVGASSEPNMLSFGVGFAFESFRFDLASSYHSQLGYAPQASLTYVPGKK